METAKRTILSIQTNVYKDLIVLSPLVKAWNALSFLLISYVKLLGPVVQN